MNHPHRLIYDFKKQNKKTIWKHLSAMAENYVVYSEHIKGIAPHLENNDIYAYTLSNDLVLVCVDLNVKEEELADEERFYDEPPLYFSQTSHRVSPVWKLSQAMKQISEKLVSIEHDYWNVWGVLLSGSHFLNAEDMQGVWEAMHITVIDQLTTIRRHKIEVNNDLGIPSGIEFRECLKDLLTPKPEQSDETNESNESHDNGAFDEDFQALLDDFIKRMDSEIVDTDEKSDEEETTEAHDDDELDNDWSLDDDGPFDTDDPLANIDLPTGNIEQNGNISVRVKILPPMANPREELDKLVGCKDIKKRIDELLALTTYNKMLRESFPGAKQHEVSLHSIFFGRPGTGKTTVCKIFGSLLREAGALSKGHVVVADRGTFIGTLWGDEERSVRQVLEKAKGGVLMIDEAYLLNGKHDNDPGRLVIQLLMELLADETQRDIAVVLCGYKEPMQKLLDMNPGLHSRFPNRFEFTDFTVDELLEITKRRLSEYEYQFTQPAWQKFKEVINSAYQVRDPQSWGNARFVANQLERIYIQHAQRCVKEPPKDKAQIRVLIPDDITPIEVPRPKPRIGF
ncbi:AAA family ATPase [uncultured Prevotella sp.]|uniref:AAA family ATPase n=1 Tax=uncultured Prevotella sp. TaxID=159272 RepID=UPI0025F11584|nr:AAA family ATPase [uncultured Prevotella sp.]